MNLIEHINKTISIDKYKALFITKAGVIVLEGMYNKHSLPLHSNSSNAVYGMLAQDRTYLTEIRIYDEKGNIIIELANHPKPISANNYKYVCMLHYHTYDGRKRNPGVRIKNHPEIENKYYDYIQELIEL